MTYWPDQWDTAIGLAGLIRLQVSLWQDIIPQTKGRFACDLRAAKSPHYGPDIFHNELSLRT